MKKAIRLLFGVSAALLFVAGVSNAETVRKLHTSPQLIINQTGSAFNDTNEPTSSTIDLSGGDLDKCSFAVYIASGAGSALASLDLEISPDGGTTWVPTGDTISVSTSTTVSYEHADDYKVSPGTKARLKASLAATATYYQMKVWAMPSVD